MGGQAVVWLARPFSFVIRVCAKVGTKFLFRKNVGGEGAFGEAGDFAGFVILNFKVQDTVVAGDVDHGR